MLLRALITALRLLALSHSLTHSGRVQELHSHLIQSIVTQKYGMKREGQEVSLSILSTIRSLTLTSDKRILITACFNVCSVQTPNLCAAAAAAVSLPVILSDG